jgi:hypothetical protein
MDLNTIRALVVGKAPKSKTLARTHACTHARTHALPPSPAACFVSDSNRGLLSLAHARGEDDEEEDIVQRHFILDDSMSHKSRPCAGAEFNPLHRKKKERRPRQQQITNLSGWIDWGWLHFPSSMREQ